MNTPQAQQRDAAAPTEPPIPTAVKTLLAQLGDWQHTVSHATGPATFGGLSEETDGEGKRHQIEVVEQVASVCLRACHPDGRAFVALWLQRPSTGRWSLDLAFRARHHGEPAPQRLKATELTAYVAASGPPADPQAAEQLARDLAELARYRAMWAANADVWVPIPQRWASVEPGSVVVGVNDALWTVAAVEPAQDGPIVRIRSGWQEWAGRMPMPTVPVLVPVPVRDALTLLRSELGSRIMSDAERKTA